MFTFPHHHTRSSMGYRPTYVIIATHAGDRRNGAIEVNASNAYSIDEMRVKPRLGVQGFGRPGGRFRHAYVCRVRHRFRR
jgi:hypothetical protein